MDIDHTQNMKYFTFSPQHYPNIDKMFKTLSNKGRKCVCIVDCHIKQDPGYHIYSSLSKNGFFVKKPDGATEFAGKCWPETSCWVDFMNKNARDFWSKFFHYENYPHTNKDIFFWNDMNEPAIFNDDPRGFPKDNLHTIVEDKKPPYQIEHRYVHNIYGHNNVRATY